MNPAATTPPNTFPSMRYTNSVSKKEEIIFPTGHDASTGPSIATLQALFSAVGGTAAALLTASLSIASQTLEEANDKNGAKWMDRGASLWLGVSITLWGAAAYFCILDKLAKRSNDANPKVISLAQFRMTTHERSTFSMNGSDLT